MKSVSHEELSPASRDSFPWDSIRMILEGASPLDVPRMSVYTREQAEDFLRQYGFDLTLRRDQDQLREMHAEAVAFIRKYFLMRRAGHAMLQVPRELEASRDIANLLLLASDAERPPMALWACAILRVMHTIHLANLAFSREMLDDIRRQILDPFRRCVQVDELGCPMLEVGSHRVQLEGIFFKEGKSRDSVLLKLLHKPGNIIQQIYDMIGVQFVTRTRLDALLVVRFLTLQNLVLFSNIVPGRSINNLIDLDALRRTYEEMASVHRARDESHELGLLEILDGGAQEFAKLEATLRNPFSGSEYRSIQFTCQKLVRVPNPSRARTAGIVRAIRRTGNRALLEEVLGHLRSAPVEKRQAFYFPFEVQILDFENYLKTSMGESSHAAYKKRQVLAAQRRVLQGLL